MAVNDLTAKLCRVGFCWFHCSERRWIWRYNAFDDCHSSVGNRDRERLHSRGRCSLSDRCPRDFNKRHLSNGFPRRLMELDLRLMLTIGTCLVSIVSAAAIAKVQIKNLMEDYEALRRSLSDLDKRMDMNDQKTSMVEQRTNVLSDINSPTALKEHWTTIASIQKDVEWMKKKVTTICDKLT